MPPSNQQIGSGLEHNRERRIRCGRFSSDRSQPSAATAALGQPALFQKFQKLIYAETGIWLGSSKTALLCGRLFAAFAPSKLHL